MAVLQSRDQLADQQPKPAVVLHFLRARNQLFADFGPVDALQFKALILTAKGRVQGLEGVQVGNFGPLRRQLLFGQQRRQPHFKVATVRPGRLLPFLKIPIRPIRKNRPLPLSQGMNGIQRRQIQRPKPLLSRPRVLRQRELSPDLDPNPRIVDRHQLRPRRDFLRNRPLLLIQNRNDAHDIRLIPPIEISANLRPADLRGFPFHAAGKGRLNPVGVTDKNVVADRRSRVPDARDAIPAPA